MSSRSRGAGARARSTGTGCCRSPVPSRCRPSRRAAPCRLGVGEGRLDPAPQAGVVLLAHDRPAPDRGIERDPSKVVEVFAPQRFEPDPGSLERDGPDPGLRRHHRMVAARMTPPKRAPVAGRGHRRPGGLPAWPVAGRARCRAGLPFHGERIFRNRDPRGTDPQDDAKSRSGSRTTLTCAILVPSGTASGFVGGRAGAGAARRIGLRPYFRPRAGCPGADITRRRSKRIAGAAAAALQMDTRAGRRHQRGR